MARRAVVRWASWVVAAWLAAPAAVALGQVGDIPGGYPAPTSGFPIGQPADPSGFGVPGLPTPDPFGIAPPPGFAGVPTTDRRGFDAAPTVDPGAFGAGSGSTGAPGAWGGDPADAPETADDGPVRLAIDPPTLALDGGGRALTVRASSALPPSASLLLDVRFDGDRFALTAIEPDPMLAAGGARQTVRHRLEPGRLRLALAYTATAPAQLPSGLPTLARLTFAPLAAGSGQVTLGGAAAAIGADGTRHDLVLDAPATLVADDAPGAELAAQIRAQASALAEQSVAAGELGGGGGASDLAGRIVDRLGRALSGVGSGDRAPLLAWIGALLAAAVVIGVGYAVGRAPDAAPSGGPGRSGARRRRAPDGVDVEHEIVEPRAGGPFGRT